VIASALAANLRRADGPDASHAIDGATVHDRTPYDGAAADAAVDDRAVTHQGPIRCRIG
jgi:hypothetical protein